MKSICHSILLILLISLSACHDECEPQAEDCIAAAIKRSNMIRYTGQELSCRTYMTLRVLNGQNYFMYGNACANMIFSATDCSGTEFCEPVTNECSSYFMENSTFVGIVGISEEDLMED